MPLQSLTPRFTGTVTLQEIFSSDLFSLFPLLTLVLLTWGAFAFGAEYAWAYAPLLVLSVTAGQLGLYTSRGVRFSTPSVAMALVALLVVGVVQLFPLPQRAVAAVSPTATATNYDQLYAKATIQPAVPATASSLTALRPLSIAPWRTMLGLVFVSAFVILFVGCVRGIGAVGPRGIARGILVLGVLGALLEIIHTARGSNLAHGLWSAPPAKSVQSAPFINPNHTAGWLLMALSLSAGHLAGAAGRGLRGVKPDWRHRILWLSSRDASETLLTGLAIAVMAISIVATASRSGFLCLVTTIVLFGGWVVKRQTSSSRRAIGAAYIVFVLIMGAAWGSADVVLRRFQGSEQDLGGRLRIWQDTLHIIRDFPLAGTGLNTYGIAMLHYQTAKAPADELFIEAHNDYLQIAAEGGLLLGVPILIALGLFVREIRRRFRERADDTRTYWLRAGAVTGLCAIAVQELFDFTLQMPGAAALFVVLAAIAIHRPDHVRRAPVTVG